jgi:GGDEF domain-containing protein
MPVLSFRKSVDELDQAAELLTAFRDAVARCIQTTAQYVVELKEQDARAFRGNLEELASRAEHSSPADLDNLHASFRGELRNYRDRVQAEVARMRAEMADVIESMHSFVENVSGSNQDHQRTLRREFDILETTAQAGDLDSIRGAIHHAAETAIHSCEEIQRAQDLITAQLQDEIRNLHKEVDHERRAALSDPITGVWNRKKLDSRIKDLILLNEGFCVFFVGLPSLAHISRNDLRMGHELLKSLTGRMHTVAGKNGELGMTGRWSEEVFAIVFNLPLAGAPATPEQLCASLGGHYAIQLDLANHDLSIEVRIQAVERPKDFAESAFYLQLGQAAFHATAR